MKKNKIGLLFSLFIIILSGCAKNPENPGYSRFMVVNAVPNRTSIDIFVDNEKANVTPLGFGANSIYYGITPGDRGIVIFGNILTNFPTGAVTTTSMFQQARFMIDRDDRNMPNYTLIPLNRAESAELLMIRDDLTIPAPGKGGIRLIHAGSDAPRVNAFIGAATTPIFSATNGYGFKESTPFIPLDAATTGTSYSIQIRNTTTGAIVRTQPVTVVPGKLYTIVLRGLVTPDPVFPGNSISSTLITNN